MFYTHIKFDYYGPYGTFTFFVWYNRPIWNNIHNYELQEYLAEVIQQSAGKSNMMAKAET